MRKLTITATRGVLKKPAAEFHSRSTISLYAQEIWFRLCWQKAFRADGFTLTSQVSECTLADLQRATKITIA